VRTLIRHGPVPPRPAELDPPVPVVRANQWNAVRKPCACGTEIVAADNPGMIQAAVTAHNATPVHRLWRSEQDAVNKLRKTIPVKTCPCHDGEHPRQRP